MNEDSAPRRSRWGALAALLLLVLLAALSYGGWRFWRMHHDAQDAQLQRLSQGLADTRGELEQLRHSQADQASTLHQSAEDLARLQGRADDTGQALSHLSADVKGGRTRTRLFAVEELLLFANDRVQLAHDARGAAVALELAQERLNGMAEPGLFEVRKAVADERAALLVVPQADREAAALSLAGLIDRAKDLPLRSLPTHPAAPASAGTPAAHAAQAAKSGGWLERGWDSLRTLLSAVFIVHRSDRPVDRLLPPEQETLVLNLFALKLESARAAALLDDTASYHSALDSALQWLADYYRIDDPAVVAAHDELQRLRGLDLSPPLPDVSHSLKLLRAYLDAGG